VGASSFIDLIAPQVNKIVLNGQELDPVEVFQDDRIALPSLLSHNDLLIEATCAYSHTGEGLHRFTDPADGQTYLYTQFEPADARRVFAVFEQPDIKARFEFHVIAPSDWTVLSNQSAALGEEIADGQTLHHFPPTEKLSSYLTALAAGPWAEWHDQLVSTSGHTIPLAIYARRSLAEFVDAANIFEITKQGFEFYEPAFDFPYPFSKYDQVFCPEYNFGAMENAGLVTITESYVFRSRPVEATVERRAVTILHELAHMWFGDLVTMRWWDDLWLNESFAEFISHLAAAKVTRWHDAWTTFGYNEKTWAYMQDQLPTTHPILAPIEDLDDVQNNFDGITYAKGASVLRQLVAWVGQDTFFEGLRTYFAKHAWGNTELNDLLTELEAISGRDLASWSELWLRSAGVNTITVDAGREFLSQTGQQPYPAWRPALIAVGGYSLVDGEINRYWDTEVDLMAAQTPLPRLRPADLVLVNDRDLAYAKIRLDPASLAFAREAVGKIADPLARSVVWGMLWDMTRDGEWPGRAFVERVLTAVSAETSSTGMRKLLGELTFTLEHYVAPEYRSEATQGAADKLWQLAEQAEASSDAQLQLVRVFARHATSPAQLDLVEELLVGSRSLTGLNVDTDLSWDLLEHLVVAGRAGEDRIDRQLAADRTHSGLERAAALRAAQPTAEAKAAAWLRAVEDPATPNGTQRAIISGWSRVVDRSLLVPFVEPYFAALVRIWKDRSPEIASNIVTGLYPSLVASLPGTAVIAATKRFLDSLNNDLPPLRRLVVEALDQLQRDIAAQATDRAAGPPRPW
jgi:aminopeptidase N